jgi:hypothetical protein
MSTHNGKHTSPPVGHSSRRRGSVSSACASFDPQAVMRLVDGAKIAEIAAEARKRLERVLAAV